MWMRRILVIPITTAKKERKKYGYKLKQRKGWDLRKRPYKKKHKSANFKPGWNTMKPIVNTPAKSQGNTFGIQKKNLYFP